MSNNNNPEQESWIFRSGLYVLGLVGLIVALFVFSVAFQSFGIFISEYFPLFGYLPNVIDVDQAKDTSQYGLFGDFVGGSLNPVLAFLTFMGVLLTVHIQAKELRLTRQEMSKSSEALNEQSKSLKRQNFENTFFQLIRLLNENVNAMRVGRVEGSFEGREVVNHIYITLGLYRGNITKVAREKGEEKQTPDLEAFSNISKSFSYVLYHYFRNIYSICKYIDDSDFFNSDDEKAMYARILRTQFSSQELVLIFYNCLTERGSGLKKYAEKFALFDNLAYGDRFICQTKLLSKYDQSAFGDNEEILNHI